jgi:hypothetical protein
MTFQITRNGEFGVQLTVALEFGNAMLSRAAGPQERAAAMTFNLDLWRSIRTLAETTPGLVDTDFAAAAEAAIADPRPEHLAAVNARQAGILAARRAPAGALRRLLEAWAEVSHHRDRPDFGRWLLDRVDAGSALSTR